MTPFEFGQRFTASFKVSTEIYKGFIALFKDSNPLHTNEQFAINKGFNGRVMHGNILNGFLSYFVGELLTTENVIIHSQSILFKNPVYEGDELGFEAAVTDIFESVNAVEFKYAFKNSGGTVVAKGKVQIGILV